MNPNHTASKICIIVFIPSASFCAV